MAGRPRKAGPRHPGGKLKQDAPGDTVAFRDFIVDVAPKIRNKNTVQARLWIHKKITADQFDAADWYHEQHAAYQRAIQSPGAPRESVSGQKGILTPEEVETRVSRLVRRFEALQIKLNDGQKKALECITLQVFDFRQIPALVTALQLIHNYRMDGNRKRA